MILGTIRPYINAEQQTAFVISFKNLYEVPFSTKLGVRYSHYGPDNHVQIRQKSVIRHFVLYGNAVDVIERFAHESDCNIEGIHFDSQNHFILMQNTIQGVHQNYRNYKSQKYELTKHIHQNR